MFKQLILVRNDLNENKDFEKNQIINASLSSGTRTMNIKKIWFDIWVANNRPKEVKSVNPEILKKLESKIKTMNIPFSYTYFKQIPTCIGIGPASELTIEKIKELADSMNNSEDDKTSNTNTN